MENLLLDIRESFQILANKEDKFWMEKYMRNQFVFFGIKSESRKSIFNQFKISLPKNLDYIEVANALFQQKEREWKYLAFDYLFTQKKHYDHRLPELMDQWANIDPWWDSIDNIAPRILGPYFLKFPEEREKWVKLWLKSPNFWHQRYCIIFQLLYKKDMDTQLLQRIILSQLHSKEFFIQKAIGWVLRQYARTNPDFVWDFCMKTPLAPLSKREAIKHLHSI